MDPVGLKTDKYGLFYEKNQFLPDANQKSECAVGGRGGGYSAPLFETDMRIEFGMCKIGGLHPSFVQTELKMQKPYFCHQNVVCPLIK